MSIIKIGSSKDKKGVEVVPNKVLFNGNRVKKMIKDNIVLFEENLTWFSNGRFYNEDVLGAPNFYFRKGVNNYGSDGFIYLPNYATEGDSMLYTGNVIPRGKYKRVEVSFELTSQYGNSTYRFGFGLTATKNNTANVGNREYKTNTFNTSASKVKEVYDLTTYNASSKDLYFFVGGVAVAKIYKIEFFE